MRNFQQYPLPALNFSLSVHNKPAAPEPIKVWLRCKDDLGSVSGNVNLANLIFTIIARCYADCVSKVFAEMTLAIEAAL